MTVCLILFLKLDHGSGQVCDVDVNRTQPLQDPGKKVVRYYIVIINWIEHDKLATVSSIHEWHQSCFKMIEPTCNDLPSPLVIHPTIGEYTLVSQENQFNNFRRYQDRTEIQSNYNPDDPSRDTIAHNMLPILTFHHLLKNLSTYSCLYIIDRELETLSGDNKEEKTQTAQASDLYPAEEVKLNSLTNSTSYKVQIGFHRTFSFHYISQSPGERLNIRGAQGNLDKIDNLGQKHQSEPIYIISGGGARGISLNEQYQNALCPLPTLEYVIYIRETFYVASRLETLTPMKVLNVPYFSFYNKSRLYNILKCQNTLGMRAKNYSNYCNCINFYANVC